jgi:hypothetical protein
VAASEIADCREVLAGAGHSTLIGKPVSPAGFHVCINGYFGDAIERGEGGDFQRRDCALWARGHTVCVVTDEFL